MEFKPAAVQRQPNASKVAEVRKKGAKLHLFPTDPESENRKHNKSSRLKNVEKKMFLNVSAANRQTDRQTQPKFG